MRNCSEMGVVAIGAWSGNRTSPFGFMNKLQIPSRRKLDLWQGCHEVAEKSSKIVPLGAPFFSRCPRRIMQRDQTRVQGRITRHNWPPWTTAARSFNTQAMLHLLQRDAFGLRVEEQHHEELHHHHGCKQNKRIGA